MIILITYTVCFPKYVVTSADVVCQSLGTQNIVIVFGRTDSSAQNFWIGIGLLVITVLFVVLMMYFSRGRVSFDAASAYIRGWSDTYYIHGRILEDDKNLKNNKKAQRIAASLEEIIAKESNEATTLLARCDLGIAYTELGFLYRMMNDFNKAEKHLAQGAGLLRTIYTQTPENKLYQTAENEFFWKQGEELFRSDHPNFTELVSKSFKSEPRKKHVSDQLAVALFRQAELKHVLGNYAEARQGYEESLKFANDQSSIKVIINLLKQLQTKAE